MANVDKPIGFRPSRYVDGAPFNGAGEIHAFSASDSAAAYVGDVVQFDATNRATALTDPAYPGIPFVLAPTSTVTTTAIRGILLGFVPQPFFTHSPTASLGVLHRAASTARYAWVVVGKEVVFEVQETGNDYASATDNQVGKTADILYAAGSTTTGLSGTQLAAGAASGVKAFKVLRYTQRIDNFNFTAADASSNAKLDVVIANSDFAQANVGQ